MLDREHNLSRLEKHLLRGMSNQHELAAAFGVTQQCVCEWIKIIYLRWKDAGPHTPEEARTLRVKQLDSLAVMAINEFERSSIPKKVCSACLGEGETEDKPGEVLKCKNCGGSGVLARGKVGDAIFLGVAKTCIEAAAKLEGIYPETLRISKTILEEGRMVGGEFQRRVEEIYFEAPVDTIIKAKAVLDQLRLELKSGEAKRIIETTVEENKNG